MNYDLMLIDGHALIHRAFHALPPLTTSSGELTNAVFGFASILLKELDELRPTQTVMAFDRPVPTFRHEAYADYKATRPPTPLPLASQFQRVRQLADVMRVPIYEVDRYEADDVLGTLARQAEQQGLSTVIVTGDLDALQLVTDGVHVLTPGRGIGETMLYDPKAVRERYGLDPSQLPDWKAMVGDTSDNIPGVPGIGKTSASNLLSEFSSLEGVYAHLDRLKPNQRKALEENHDQALRSRELARIVLDAPVQLGAVRVEPGIDRQGVIDLFRELEFRTLIERVQAMYPSGERDVKEHATGQLSLFSKPLELERSPLDNVASPVEAASFPAISTRVVQTQEGLADLVHELLQVESFAVDTETTSTDPMAAKLVGVSFSVDGEHAWYVPVGHTSGGQLPLDLIREKLRPALENEGIHKIGHNLKYDYQILRRCGLRMRGMEFDTMIAAYLLNPQGRGLSLDALAMSRLGIEMTHIHDLIGKGRKQLSMAEVPIDRVADYAGEDAAVSLRLHASLEPELKERELDRLFEDVEMPLVPVLAEMELNGVSIDVDVLQTMSREMTDVLGNLEASIYDRVGHRFNINSPTQLGQILFQELKLPLGRRTKTGYSTDSEVLERLSGQHAIVDEILEYRQVIKLKNTYVDALPSLLHPEDSHVHTDFNQCAVATGRLSSSNPNLQNIPVRGELGRRIRRAFISTDPSHRLLAADYSQIELRIMAAMSGDPKLVDAFATGEDVHQATAAAIFRLPLDDVSPDQRRIAKVVNFGIMYGIGEQRLAHETNISRSEAADFIANYNQTYAGVRDFMNQLRRQAAYHGYVSTLLNRRRYLPDIHSNHPGVRAAAERAAINMPIQGSAADIIKVAMIHLHNALERSYPQAHMLLQVHDELVFDVPAHQVEEIASLVRDCMEHAITLPVPLEVDMKVGRDWYDMEPLAA